MNNFSEVWSKANETKLDPFSKTGPQTASGNHPWLPDGAGKHRDKVGRDLNAGLALLPYYLLLTLVYL